MNEGSAGQTAGALLRAAREKQGLHIAALAAAIKVSPRKLDALENDRYDELPDATFARALAQTICRSLRIDPQPILALLPRADASSLEHVAGTLNTPFRDRAGGSGGPGVAAAAIRPLIWASGALMIAAVVVYFLPSDLWKSSNETVADSVPATDAGASSAAGTSVTTLPSLSAASAPQVVADAPVTASAPAGTVAASPAPGTTATTTSAAAAPISPIASQPKVDTVHAAPPPALTAAGVAAPGASSAMPANILVLRTTEASWIEVRDALGQVLLSRTVQLGESVGLDGARPLKVIVGNAAATQVFYRGQPVGLTSNSRDNVARLELQ